jgi:hypothetical protein
MRGILLNETLIHRVSEDPAKEPNSSRGCTETSSHNRFAPLLACFLYRRSLSARDIFNKFVDVSRFKTLDTLLANERHDMPIDASAVYIE